MPSVPAGHRAKDIMSSPALTIGKDESVAAAAKLMLEKNVGALPVVGAEGKYLGMVTERTLIPHEENAPFLRRPVLVYLGQFVGRDEEIEQAIADAKTRKVSDLMSKRMPTVVEGTPVSELAAKMIRGNVHHLPVLRDGKVVGIVSRHDLLRVMAGPP
jgi:CBS domain-containing protein